MRDMGALDLATPVQYVRGVGPARAAELATLGVRTVGELVEHFPFRYELAPKSQPIGTLTLGETATIVGDITDVRLRGSPGHRTVTARVEDATGRARVVWFNAAYLADRIRVGQSIRLTGKVDVGQQYAQFKNPRFTLFDGNEDPLENDADRFEPVYPATGKLPSRQIARIIRTALAEVAGLIQEPLPEPLRARRTLPPRRTAVERYHHPTRSEDVDVARRRLAYDEFLLMQLAVQLRRHQAATATTASPVVITPLVDERIRARLPFALTPGQNRAVAEIAADLAQSRPMNRLLQADVGAGKTAVAVYAALGTIAARRQVALLAPTEILAEQHSAKVGRYLAGSRVRLALLTGGLAKRHRGEIYAQASRHELDLVIGTHALLEEGMQFPALGLVIIDEQHRFGVEQRGRLRAKGESPHYLVLTATPIPRTLAMTFFGDLNVSTIDDLPPGRPPVETRLLGPAEIGRAWSFVRQRVQAGEQAFVVYPLVEESEKLPLKAASEQMEHLAREALSGCRLGLLHGQMRAAQKDAVMEQFRAAALDVLVATTVVEVGIDVPNATVMVIEHAERYGLSQLHQLRGRIGRGTRPSYCLLCSDTDNEESLARLRVLCQTRNGFRIAEEDLRLRGPGEVLGTRQHGMPMFRVADLLSDLDLLQAARDDAAGIVARDPRLGEPDHRVLREMLRARFAEVMPLIDVA